MSDETTCFTLVLGIILVIVIIFIIAVVRQARAKTKRAEKIIELFQSLSRQPFDRVLEQELLALLQNPIGRDPRLAQPGGWFERVSPALTQLLFNRESAGLVGWFFVCFEFSPGQQKAALSWLHEMLTRAVRQPATLTTLEQIADRLLTYSVAAEANWMYQRVLELLRSHPTISELKTLALTAGRRAYSAGRPDRKPTIYDEQAIANDIAARS